MAPNNTIVETTPVADFEASQSTDKHNEYLEASDSPMFYEQSPPLIICSVKQQEVVIDIEEPDAEMTTIEDSLCRQAETFINELESSMQPRLRVKYSAEFSGRRQRMLELAACLQYDNGWKSPPSSHTLNDVRQEENPKEYVLFPETPWLTSALLTHYRSESPKPDPVFDTSLQKPDWPSQPFDFNNPKGRIGRCGRVNLDVISQLFANISLNQFLQESPESSCQPWTARDFRLTPMPRPQLTTDAVPYYIELLDGAKGWQQRLNPSNFRVTLIKPYGVSVSELPVIPDERGLSFLVASNQSGYHKLVVLFVASGQKPAEVFGSPLNIRIMNVSPTPTRNPLELPLSFRKPVIDFKPWGFAQHRMKGLVYITESYYNRIHVINIMGVHQFVIELNSSMTRGMYRPTGIAVCEKTDRLYVADKDNHRVLVFNWDGEFIVEFGCFGDGDGQFNFPWGVAVSPDGTLLAVSEPNKRRIQLFNTSNMSYINQYRIYDRSPADTRNTFDSPGDLLFDHTGIQLYVSDFNVRAIIIINVSDLTQRFFTPPIFTRPQGMCWDLQGNLLVADMASGKVVALDRTGKRLDRPQSWKDIQTPLNVLQLRNGFILAVTEKYGIVTVYDPRST